MSWFLTVKPPRISRINGCRSTRTELATSTTKQITSSIFLQNCFPITRLLLIFWRPSRSSLRSTRMSCLLVLGWVLHRHVRGKCPSFTLSLMVSGFVVFSFYSSPPFIKKKIGSRNSCHFAYELFFLRCRVPFVHGWHLAEAVSREVGASWDLFEALPLSYRADQLVVNPTLVTLALEGSSTTSRERPLITNPLPRSHRLQSLILIALRWWRITWMTLSWMSGGPCPRGKPSWR